jgi:hypothetical protein
MRSFFIQFHQPAVASDIAGDDRSKAPWRCAARRLTMDVRFEVADFTHALGLPQTANDSPDTPSKSKLRQ